MIYFSAPTIKQIQIQMMILVQELQETEYIQAIQDRS